MGRFSSIFSCAKRFPAGTEAAPAARRDCFKKFRLVVILYDIYWGREGEGAPQSVNTVLPVGYRSTASQVLLSSQPKYCGT